MSEDPTAENPATPGPILVTFAVKEEAKFFKRPPGVRVLITGMGRSNSEQSIYWALDKVAPPARHHLRVRRGPQSRPPKLRYRLPDR